MPAFCPELLQGLSLDVALHRVCGDTPTETGLPGAAVKPPPPLHSRIVTLFDTPFTTARSIFPSLLKSFATIAKGNVPTATGLPKAVNPPAPLPSRIVTCVVFGIRDSDVLFPTAIKITGGYPNRPVADSGITSRGR
jgi:hypothetical protein